MAQYALDNREPGGGTGTKRKLGQKKGVKSWSDSSIKEEGECGVGGGGSGGGEGRNGK